MMINLNEFLKLEIKDEVIIFPTDTVYGIGAKIDSKKALTRIFELKSRDKTKPLSVLCADIEQLKKLVIENDAVLEKCNVFWPGAITFILKKSENINELISTSDTIGVRIPNCDIALEILKKTGPLATTSVNISGQSAAITIDEAKKIDADYIITNEVNSLKVASTVFDVTNMKILREGDIKESDLLKTFSK